MKDPEVDAAFAEFERTGNIEALRPIRNKPLPGVPGVTYGTATSEQLRRSIAYCDVAGRPPRHRTTD